MLQIARSPVSFVRYDPDVRLSLVVVLILLFGAGAADAKRRREIDVFGEREPPRPCARAKTWSFAKKCLDKAGTTNVVYQTDTAKVVTFVLKGARSDAGKQVVFFSLVEAAWVRTDLGVTLSPTTELLHAGAFSTPTGDAVRVDTGVTMHTTFALGSAGVVEGVTRRTFAAVCMPSQSSCWQMMTSCEAYVHGRVFWTFHSEIVWHPSLGLRLRGATTAAGGLCTPSKSMMIDEESAE